MFDPIHLERRQPNVLERLAFILLIALALTGCTRPALAPTTRAPGTIEPLFTQAPTSPSFATLPPITPPSPVTPTAPVVQGVIQPPVEPTQTVPPAATPTASPTVLPPTPTEPAGLQPACLVGSWEVADLPGAMARSYAQSGATLQLQAVEGQALYAFDANGSMSIAYRGLSARFRGQIENREVAIEQTIDGSASARYQVDLVAQQVVLSDYGGEGVQFGLDINGQRLAEGNMPVWQAFTSSLNGQEAPDASQVEYSRATVSCSGDAMTIQAVEPLPGPVVELVRVP